MDRSEEMIKEIVVEICNCIDNFRRNTVDVMDTELVGAACIFFSSIVVTYANGMDGNKEERRAFIEECCHHVRIEIINKFEEIYMEESSPHPPDKE